VIVCDTGLLVAAAFADDAHHRECVNLFASLQLAGRRILVPGPVVAGVGYLLARTGGARAEAQFLTSLAERTFSTVELTADDYRRAAELVLTYEDLPLGTTDATVVALCERLGLSEVATLDRRHFTVVRPRHVEALRLLPE
jgi:predicted nucleic acid-binding protein